MASQGVRITLDTTAQPKSQFPPFDKDGDAFVRAACTEFQKPARVVETSLTDGGPPGTPPNYVGTHGGLITTVLEAHNNRRHLVLRRDDFMIAVQKLLADRHWKLHEDSRKEAEAGISILRKDKIRPDNPQDYKDVTKMVISKITQNAPALPKDDTYKLIKYVLKGSMLPSMKEADADKKGSNELFGVGGIPSVILLGAKSDWEKLQHDFQSLVEDDHTLEPYCVALVKLSRYFVKSFEKPEDEDVIHFWSLMCPQWQQKGWLAVFNTWNTSDKEIGLTHPLEVKGVGVNIELDTYAGTIKENRVSSGYRKLKFSFRQGKDTRSRQRVTFAAGHLGTQFWRSPSNGEVVVRPAAGWVIFM